MKELDLLEGKILPTMLRLAAPLMGTAFIQLFYSLTDMAWIGRISTEAVAAAGVGGFLLWLASSFVMVPRIGLSILTAQFYGRRDRNKVKLVINNGVWMGLIMGILYGLFLYFFRDPLIQFYRLEGPVNALAEDYLVIIAMGMPIFFINPVLSGAYNSLGNSRTPFRINAIGLATNIIGDPLLIFGLGPFPELGIRGAALATVSAQVIILFCFIFVIVKSQDLVYHSKLLSFTYRKGIFADTFKLGLPAALQSAFHASISIILNRYVSVYGAIALAVTSIGSNIESISWVTTEGFANAITAFSGQNYGAGLSSRMEEIFHTSMKSVGTIGILATVILITFRNHLYKLFVPGDMEAIALGASYLFILGLSQFFMSIEIGSTGFLNGLGETRLPALINTLLNISRIPLSLILMPSLGSAGVWWAMTLSSVVKGILLYILARCRLNKLGLSKKML